MKIIYQGCPEEKVRNRLLSDPIIKSSNIYSTKMKVFRFDGSRRVRIKCSIDVCVESCPPLEILMDWISMSRTWKTWGILDISKILIGIFECSMIFVSFEK
ncbi:unnamed protein product [Caenorhabditis angaria]|uniref:ZP domain-containing protein n=1 Tax=Caenorhabditis angaria TaxID=860376 RepID=A0A9P1INF5_9PELO|nr:unnamed protein product [Caenorhabditis angaria]